MEQKAYERVCISILQGLLIVMTLANVIPAFIFGFAGQVPKITASIYTPKEWFFTVYGFLSVVNIIGLVALLCWRKWGFYLLFISVVPTTLFQFLAERDPLLTFSKLSGYMILFGFLYYWKGHKSLRQFK